MVHDILVSEADIIKAGTPDAAKLTAIDSLIERTIGVDIYILSGFSDARAKDGMYTVQNWVNQNVLVAPLLSDSKLGKTIQVVKATFDSNGLLLPEFSDSNTIGLQCNVPESSSVRAMVDAQELLREETMSLQVAEISDAIIGLEIYLANGDDHCVLLSPPTNASRVRWCGCQC